VPLVWAVVLLFHGARMAPTSTGACGDEASRYLTVHLVSLVFLGLMGAALYLLLRDLPGRAAQISRLAIGPFVVFYVPARPSRGRDRRARGARQRPARE